MISNLVAEDLTDTLQSPGEETGYLHRDYAESLAEFGNPHLLKNSRGWILEREIAGFPYKDAMGCYSLFACQNWSRINTDMAELGNDLISLSIVTDPLGDYSLSLLHRCFKDVVIDFKEHFVIDLSRSTGTSVSGHHRRNAKKALQDIRVEKCDHPGQYINEWIKLYDNLIERHKITGIRAFSALSFAKQMNVPGLVMFRAIHEDTTAGMALWYVHGNAGYYHLGACNTLGYKLRASFALFRSAINYFSDSGLKWLNLGSGAGRVANNQDGLTRFKRGWATGRRTAYFCGRIFDHTRYREIVRKKKITTTEHFPAYRTGEFG